MSASLTLLLASLTLWGLSGCARQEDRSEAENNNHEASNATYACPMLCVPPTHKPGKCPVCGMNLERIENGSSVDAGKPVIAISDRSRKLAVVEVAPVERRSVAAEIRMVGKVAVDEMRVANVAARVAGRIDRVFADFTGMRVEKGDHLVSIYSPELLSAQEELLQSLRTDNQATVDAAREKLRLLGVNPPQIKEIEDRGRAADHMTVYSPAGGVIISKDAVEGMYVKTGTGMYTIADLSRLWVKLDAYEADIGLIQFGQPAELTAESYPGRRFKGTVAFIDPVLDEKTRTVKVRLNVANEDGALKPGMFVRAILRSPLDAYGKPMGPDLAGKWLCPMHPEIVKNTKGICDICEMDLVTAEEAGIVRPADSAGTPLVIPASAPLITGKRAVVYVATETEGEYEGREITLGPRAGDFYVVHEGLSEGDRVVVKGNFRIDSAMQIMAKPSMMRPVISEEETVDPSAEAEPGEKAMANGKHAQTLCPVMGGAINREIFVDYKGYRIYFCCAGCDATFRKDADAYIRKMQENGVELEKTPGEN